jgi:hypothetical protein
MASKKEMRNYNCIGHLHFENPWEVRDLVEWDFALSENSKGCGVVDLCQCSRECPTKICLNLRAGNDQFSQLY